LGGEHKSRSATGYLQLKVWSPARKGTIRPGGGKNSGGSQFKNDKKEGKGDRGESILVETRKSKSHGGDAAA